MHSARAAVRQTHQRYPDLISPSAPARRRPDPEPLAGRRGGGPRVPRGSRSGRPGHRRAACSSRTEHSPDGRPGCGSQGGPAPDRRARVGPMAAPSRLPGADTASGTASGTASDGPTNGLRRAPSRASAGPVPQIGLCEAVQETGPQPAPPPPPHAQQRWPPRAACSWSSCSVRLLWTRKEPAAAPPIDTHQARNPPRASAARSPAPDPHNCQSPPEPSPWRLQCFQSWWKGSEPGPAASSHTHAGPELQSAACPGAGSDGVGASAAGDSMLRANAAARRWECGCPASIACGRQETEPVHLKE